MKYKIYQAGTGRFRIRGMGRRSIRNEIQDWLEETGIPYEFKENIGTGVVILNLYHDGDILLFKLTWL